MNIYDHELSPTAWRLLWWLLCQMDGDAEVSGPWKQRAATELKTARSWATVCAIELRKAGLIKYEPFSRVVRVVTKNILG